MKGLIRNNFYTVEGSLKVTLLLSLVATIVLAIVGKITADSGNLFGLIIGGNLGGFSALAATAMQKDAASKWNKFELTMPVSRKDVVTARYVSCMLYVLIGIVMALMNVLVLYLVTGAVHPERMAYVFVFGLGFALSMPTFMIPLVMIFGTDKTDSFMIVSIIMGLVLFFGSSAIMTPFLRDVANANLIFRLSYVVFSVILFGASYLLSCQIYQKKEL